MSDRIDPIEETYQLCKLQASVDGAFDDRLLRQWFAAVWETCADIEGLVYPPQDIVEPIVVRPDGSFRISYTPSSEIKVYDGANLLMVLPKSGERNPCHVGLCPCCACCGLTAHYTTGHEFCQIPATFRQAVMLAFTYQVENRGDTPSSERWLTRSGAMTFLRPVYVL